MQAIETVPAANLTIHGFQQNSRRSKVLVNLSTQNLLNNVQKRQKLQQIHMTQRLLK